MQAINLEAIVKKYDLDKKELAAQLFPGNKFPRVAFKRVLLGEAELNASQISKLALWVGVEISDLFLTGSQGWKKTSTMGVITLSNGLYKAELDTTAWITRVFHNDSLFHESIIHSGTTPLSEYLNKINLIIKNHKSNGDRPERDQGGH